MMNVRSVAVLITLLILFHADVLSQSNQVPDDIEFHALKDLFDSLDGPSWKNKKNWPPTDRWPSRVTVVNGDVTQIDLSDNNLTGRLPSSIGRLLRLKRLLLSNNNINGVSASLLSLPALTTIYFDNNELKSIPDFGSYWNRANLDLKLQYNRLDFSQLESQLHKGIKSLTQTPQKTINDIPTHGFTINRKLVLTARPATANTVVIWEKLDSIGSTWSALTNDDDNVANTYTRNVATSVDTGTYRWKSTNSMMPGVTIQSEPILVKTQFSFQVDNWCFQYKYDSRRRMTHKKVPGADWVYMIYDDRDRLVMTQDGEQRRSNKWIVTKYDQLNRPVMTALYTHSRYASQQDMSDNFSEALLASVNLDMLTTTYYDDYSFMSGNSDLNYRSDQLNDQTARSTSVVGKVTGVNVKVLDAPYYMTTVNYYDDMGRLLQTASENYDAGIDRVTNNYDFSGRVTATRTTHSVCNLHWQNVDRMVADGNFVKGLPTGRFGGGSSLEYIPASVDGWAEATVTEIDTRRSWGLSDVDADFLPSSIDYCFYLNGDRLQVLENGNQKMVVNDLAPGDRLRISRTGGTVNYYRNSRLVYTSLKPSSTQLHVDVSLSNGSSSLLNLSLSTARGTQTTLREFDYDHAGRLVTTRHCINNGDTIVLSKNEYNELGQLIDKKLYGKPDGNFSQNIDYQYNIRGWLTSLNADLFGIRLHYNDKLSGLDNTSMFNGNISAMQWRVNLGLSDTSMRAYTFSYDPLNRLTGSSQKAFDGRWRNESAFCEDAFKYDLNGNIVDLRRIGAKGSLMDKLKYHYGSSNQLLRVSDTGDALNGFLDGNSIGDDYVYDRNGNMITDNNKEITVTYNILNLPGSVLKNGQGTIQYYYDATGRKLGQVVRDVSGAQTKTTDYHGDFIYENDTLRLANTEEGRVVLTDEPEYQFHLKDHLGNVRMTFTTKESKDESIADFETLRADFLYYDEAIKVNSELFDHTNSGATRYSTRLNGSVRERFGLAKSLSVMPGDTVKMEVYAKYLDTNRDNWSVGLSSLVQSIANGTAATGTFIDGGLVGSTGGVSIPWSGFLDKNPEEGPAPKAYLNYLIFDRHYNFITGDAIRISTAAREDGQDGKHERLAATLLIKQAGYVYIYLSNDNLALGGEGVEVYFDDLKVEHIMSPVVQSQDYYPFGLVFNSYSREKGIWDRYQYSGKEFLDELDLGWLDYGVRMYDVTIGRWLVIDPMSAKIPNWSPSRYAFNNPIKYTDIAGLIEWPLNGNSAVNKHDRSDGGWGLANTIVRTSTYMDTNRPVGTTNPHIGIDYRASEGTGFYSLGDGKVAAIGSYTSGAKYITIEYGNGDKVTFLHITSTAEGLNVGSTVYEGQVLGQTGSTGTKQAHLHVDAKDKNGNRIDPENQNYGTVSNDDFFTKYEGDYQKLRDAKSALSTEPVTGAESKQEATNLQGPWAVIASWLDINPDIKLTIKK